MLSGSRGGQPATGQPAPSRGVYATDLSAGLPRLGAALHRREPVTVADGQLRGRSSPPAETARGVRRHGAGPLPSRIVDRAPFARSIELVQLRVRASPNRRPRRAGSGDADAAARLPAFIPRDDEIELDGLSPPAGIPAGVKRSDPSHGPQSHCRARASTPWPSTAAAYIVGRSRPTAGNHVVFSGCPAIKAPPRARLVLFLAGAPARARWCGGLRRNQSFVNLGGGSAAWHRGRPRGTQVPAMREEAAGPPLRENASSAAAQPAGLGVLAEAQTPRPAASALLPRRCARARRI